MILKALLLAIIANLASGRVWSPITWPFCYPLINGTLVGFVLGDPLLGLTAGATINLAYLGWISAGGTMPGNIGIAGTYGTAITILSKSSPSLAITLAIPIGLLGILLWQLQMTLNVFWVHRCDKNAENAELNKIWLNAGLFPQLTSLVVNGTPAFVLLALGDQFFIDLIGKIPESLISALNVTSGLLPALGVSMLLSYLGNKKILPYFVIGFFAATYLELPMMSIAIFGAAIAVLSYFKSDDSEGLDEDFIEEGEVALEKTVVLQKSDLMKNWLMGLGAEIGYNYERMQASGVVLSMVPIIRRLYTEPEDISQALKRYLVFFNTEPSFVGPIIPGICASLEEEKANGADISDEMINGLRTGLMGPMAGIGDSLAGGIIYPISISIGCSLALQGNFLGPVIFFVLFTGIMLIMSYNLYMTGYKQGKNSLAKMIGSGGNSITKLTNSFAILGLLVVGSMGADRVLVETGIIITIGETQIVLQEILNSLVLNILPFGLVFFLWWLLKKKQVSPVYVVLIIMLIGIGGFYLGIFAPIA